MSNFKKHIFFSITLASLIYSTDARAANCDFSSTDKNQSFSVDAKTIQSCIKHGKVPPKNWISGAGRNGGNKNIGSIIQTGLASVDSPATLTREITCGGLASGKSWLLKEQKTGGQESDGATGACETNS